MFRHFNFYFGCGILLIVVLASLLAPILAPYSPEEMFVGPRLSPPQWDYPFGTDMIGRDVLSRVIHGASLTLYVGAIAVGIGLSCGMLIGLTAGYSTNWLQGALMRTIDVIYSFPDILIALALVAFLGPSLRNAMIAVGISVIPFFARITYSIVVVERNKPYFDSGKVIGASRLRLIFCYLLPNIIPSLIVIGSLGFSHAVLSAAGLSFLGLGAQPPLPEWGALLADGRNYIRKAPWLMFFPGISIILVVLAFNMIGDTIREYIDPRQRWRR